MSDTPTLRGWAATESPFHTGELAIQESLGARQRIDAVARRAGIRDYMPEQHRQFFNERPFMLIGSTDADGQPWPEILVGQPGFITTPDEQTVHIAAALPPYSPLRGQLHAGSFMGMLGIQFTTGRRNRVNGMITAADDDSLTLSVRQSFGNCRKYIQARQPSLKPDPVRAAAIQLPDTDRLGQDEKALINRADTFFIASAYVNEQESIAQGADVSHRGGRPGFIRIDDDQTLTFPDFTGNFLFNTLGNLARNPRAGLMFIDFESSDLVYLAGEAHIIWDGPEVNAFAGAQRLVQLHLHTVRRVINALPVHWSPVRYSEQLAGTGTWQEAAMGVTQTL